jgi:HSP20 family molecular chaperone IbpA
MGAFRNHDLGRSLRILLGLFAWLVIFAVPAASTSFGLFQLPVMVDERPGLVRLHVLLPEGMSETSIEVRIAERDVIVVGRYPSGVPIRSRPIRLSQTVSPEGIDVSYADDGSLTITLHAVTEGGS